MLRAGQLTWVWVPDEAHEAMRNQVRMRALAMKEQRKVRQQLQLPVAARAELSRQALEQCAPSLAWRADVCSTGTASRAREALGTDRTARMSD
jgi:hypothetical protein